MTAIPPVDGLTISAARRRAAGRRPDDEALAFPKAGVQATYAQYDASVDDVARSPLALDVKRSDHVAVWAVLVTVDPAHRTHEPAYALRHGIVMDTRAPRGTSASRAGTRPRCAPPSWRGAKERLAYFKVPRCVNFSEEFPLTVAGKVRKFRIREMAIAELGLGEGHGRVAHDETTMESTGAKVAGSEQ